MTKARRIEGPCAPLFYLVATLLLLSAKITVAQSVDLSSLEICANLETPELKLACFEAIINAGNLPEEQVSEIAVAGAPENAPAATKPEIAVAAAPENEAVAVEPAVAIAAAPENEAVEVEPAVAIAGAPGNLPAAVEPESAGHSQAATEAAAVVSATTSDDDFGREQLATADQEEEKEVIKATVIDVTQGSSKLLYFHLANGHVWRQIEPRRLQYPKSDDFEVSIARGVMGEYRMRIGDNGRMVRIRRVE